jgi:hypothetical protein
LYAPDEDLDEDYLTSIKPSVTTNNPDGHPSATGTAGGSPAFGPPPTNIAPTEYVPPRNRPQPTRIKAVWESTYEPVFEEWTDSVRYWGHLPVDLGGRFLEEQNEGRWFRSGAYSQYRWTYVPV